MAILSILVDPLGTPNTLVWHYTHNGLYSVHSKYWLLMGCSFSKKCLNRPLLGRVYGLFKYLQNWKFFSSDLFIMLYQFLLILPVACYIILCILFVGYNLKPCSMFFSNTHMLEQFGHLASVVTLPTQFSFMVLYYGGIINGIGLSENHTILCYSPWSHLLFSIYGRKVMKVILIWYNLIRNRNVFSLISGSKSIVVFANFSHHQSSRSSSVIV